jgi:hypothetical protein
MALSRQARDYIRWYAPDAGVTIAGYIRSYYPDGKWGGDTCGCFDDRCIGYHHDASDPCGCLEACLDDYVAELTKESR